MPDPFLAWLYALHPGQPSDRQRWMAWAAMLDLIPKVEKSHRIRWHRFFHRLSLIEGDVALTDAERGQAFMDLLREAWPRELPRQGRPREDYSGLLSDFPEIRDQLATTWGKGIKARLAAVDGIVRRIKDLEMDAGSRMEIAERCATPRTAALTIMAYAYEQDPKSVEQALRRALKAKPTKLS